MPEENGILRTLLRNQPFEYALGLAKYLVLSGEIDHQEVKGFVDEKPVITPDPMKAEKLALAELLPLQMQSNQVLTERLVALHGYEHAENPKQLAKEMLAELQIRAATPEVNTQLEQTLQEMFLLECKPHEGRLHDRFWNSGENYRDPNEHENQARSDRYSKSQERRALIAALHLDLLPGSATRFFTNAAKGEFDKRLLQTDGGPEFTGLPKEAQERLSKIRARLKCKLEQDMQGRGTQDNEIKHSAAQMLKGDADPRMLLRFKTYHEDDDSYTPSRTVVESRANQWLSMDWKGRGVLLRDAVQTEVWTFEEAQKKADQAVTRAHGAKDKRDVLSGADTMGLFLVAPVVRLVKGDMTEIGDVWELNDDPYRQKRKELDPRFDFVEDAVSNILIVFRNTKTTDFPMLKEAVTAALRLCLTLMTTPLGKSFNNLPTPQSRTRQAAEQAFVAMLTNYPQLVHSIVTRDPEIGKMFSMVREVYVYGAKKPTLPRPQGAEQAAGKGGKKAVV